MENPADKDFHEVLTCRSAFPLLQAESTFDTSGNPVQRLSSANIVPQRSIDIARAAAACIARRCSVERQYLRVSVQTTAAPRPYLGRVHGGAVVLLDARALDANPAALTDALNVANTFAALLANTPTLSRPTLDGSEPDSTGLARQPLTIDDLAGSVLLGAKLSDPLELIVPGTHAVRLGNRLRRARPKGATTRMRTVRGRLSAIMVGGRGHRLFARAVDVMSKEKLGKFPIGFGDQWRQKIADAFARPGQEVLISFSEETFDDGTARGRVKRFLTDITLVESSTSNRG